jgi:hypothetical protein
MSHPGEDNAPSPLITAFMASVLHRPLHDGTPRNLDDVALIEYLVDMIKVIMQHVQKVEDTELECWYTKHRIDEVMKQLHYEKIELEAEKSQLDSKKDEFHNSLGSFDTEDVDSMDMQGNIHREIVKHVADAVCICNGPPEDN